MSEILPEWKDDQPEKEEVKRPFSISQPEDGKPGQAGFKTQIDGRIKVPHTLEHLEAYEKFQTAVKLLLEVMTVKENADGSSGAPLHHEDAGFILIYNDRKTPGEEHNMVSGVCNMSKGMIVDCGIKLLMH